MMTKRTSRSDPRPSRFGFGVANALVLTAAVMAIVLGYIFLDRGSVTAAPLLLVLGYVILIPVGLLLGYRKGERRKS